jgi:hypothetical protein
LAEDLKTSSMFKFDRLRSSPTFFIEKAGNNGRFSAIGYLNRLFVVSVIIILTSPHLAISTLWHDFPSQGISAIFDPLQSSPSYKLNLVSDLDSLTLYINETKRKARRKFIVSEVIKISSSTLISFSKRARWHFLIRPMLFVYFILKIISCQTSYWTKRLCPVIASAAPDTITFEITFIVVNYNDVYVGSSNLNE